MSKTLLKAATDRALRKEREAKDEKAVVVAGSNKKRAHVDTEASSSLKTLKISDNKKVKLSGDLRPITPADSDATAVTSKAAGGGGTATSLAGRVVYLGHIPDGFYEAQMEKFFKQFGNVQRIKLFRSKKNNRSRGYAFLEFDSPETAAVVADSMDGYFLMERKMVCNVVPPEKIHDKMFARPKQEPRTKKSEIDSDSDDEEKVEGEEQAEKAKEEEHGVDDTNFEKMVKAHRKLMAQKQKKLRELGIEFNIPFVQPVEERVVSPVTAAAATVATVVAPTPGKKGKVAAPVPEPEPVEEEKPILAPTTPGKTRRAKGAAVPEPEPVEEEKPILAPTTPGKTRRAKGAAVPEPEPVEEEKPVVAPTPGRTRSGRSAAVAEPKPVEEEKAVVAPTTPGKARKAKNAKPVEPEVEEKSLETKKQSKIPRRK
eukprot:gene7089-7840_t